MEESSKPRILVLSLGGTWCMMKKSPSSAVGIQDERARSKNGPDGQWAATSLSEGYDITREFPELAVFCRPTLRQLALGSSENGEPVEALDSTNLGPAHWTQVAEFVAANSGDYDGFVIMQGTDTLAFTSAALAFALRELRKPVILSGAQISKEEPGSDAPSNVVNAFRVAALADTVGPERRPVLREVTVVFGSRIIRATRCRKYSERDLEAFDTVNVPLLGRIRLKIRIDPSVVRGEPSRSSWHRFQSAPRFSDGVALLHVYPGMRAEVLEAVGHLSTGVVLAAFGAGTVPCSSEEYQNSLSLEPAIRALVEKGDSRRDYDAVRHRAGRGGSL